MNLHLPYFSIPLKCCSIIPKPTPWTHFLALQNREPFQHEDPSHTNNRHLSATMKTFHAIPSLLTLCLPLLHAHPSPLPAVNLNCQLVTNILNTLRLLGPPATAFCSSYLSVPSATTTTKTTTPKTYSPLLYLLSSRIDSARFG